MKYNLVKKAYKFIFCRIDCIKFYKNQGVKFGDNCSIVGRVCFGSEPYLVQLGDNVRLSNNVKFITHDGGVHVIRNLYDREKNIDKFNDIKVGNNVFIGMDSKILPGVKIGDNVIIGAGSIVTKDIPSNSVYAGIPAKFIKSIQQYYEDSKAQYVYTKDLCYEDKKEYLMKKYYKKERIQ